MVETKRTRAKQQKKTKPVSELGEVIAATNKRYGGSQIIPASRTIQPARISTGIFILDLALLGGMPHNRQSMIVGEKHSGKTTLSCLLIASAQFYYPDQVCVLIDLEGTFDKVWASILGVDLERLLIVQADTGEMAVDLVEALVCSRETALIIPDSLAALMPMAEGEAEAADPLVGVQSRLISRMIRKNTTALIRERKRGHLVTILYINQFRSKIGGFAGFGEPRSIPGGKALEFSTSVQLIVKNKEHSGKDESDVDIMDYNDHSYTITKNKLNNGPRTGEFKLVRKAISSQHLNVGDIDEARTLVAYAKKFGFWTGAGKAQKLEVNGSIHKFSNQDQAFLVLNEEDDFAWELRCQLIRQQAINMNMPKEFVETIK